MLWRLEHCREEYAPATDSVFLYNSKYDFIDQGSHASWNVLEIPGILFVKFPGPGKSWKMGLVLESPGNFC